MRTSLFARLIGTARAAQKPLSADEAIARDEARPSRRNVLGLGALATASVAVGSFGCASEAGSEPIGSSTSAVRSVTADIGIVGAGIAGLVCAHELKKAGVTATLHEASTRVGGRIWSMGGAFPGPVSFPGQVVERGGELIDTPHKTMIGLARELGIPLEDVNKPVRETAYLFGGQRVSEATMVDEYRVLVDAMRDDLRLSSGGPTATSFNAKDRELDQTSLSAYLAARGAPSNIKKLLEVAYTVEYGLDADRQSALAFLLFAKASRQSKIRLWGTFSDERYHCVTGNEGIVRGLADRLGGQIRLGRRLVGARKTAAGKIELSFVEGSRSVVVTHDAVVLALPFNMLREVALHDSLGLSAAKRTAIAGTVYGKNAKLMVGFTGRPWSEQGSSGAAYSDRANLQTTWETNPSAANATRGVITDYTGGTLAASLSPSRLAANTSAFLDDFEAVFPGARALTRKNPNGSVVSHLQHWPTDPFTKGSYTANATGYFTTICGHEGTAQQNLYFAGETTDSFYAWQGFMEGGALSGLRVAGEINRDFG